MNIEESKFNQPEQPEISSAETEAEPMSPEAVEQMLEEKLSELETLKQNPRH